ncbi:MAG: helix-turn-helix domain-containing protein [Planctomycetia bacterium]
MSMKKALSRKSASETKDGFPPLVLEDKNRKTYFALVTAFPLTSIASDEHLVAAQRVVDRLLTEELDGGGETYLDALSDLVAAYEDVHHSIEPASDAEMLRHLLDAKGITSAQLCREAGLAKSSISEVLAGKKGFGRGMIRKLADYFGIDAGVLAANF